MTRENKVALVIGFALVLFVGILVSDHLSKAQTQRTANLAPAVNTRPPTADAPARFVDLRTELPRRPSTPVPVVPRPIVVGQPPAPPAPPAPGEAAVVEAQRIYEVRPGESLSAICRRVYGTASLTMALAAHNGIADPDTVWAGRRLSMPAADALSGGAAPIATPGRAHADDHDGTPAPLATYRIREGDSLSDIAQRVMGSAGRWQQLYELNRQAISNPDDIRAGTVLRVPAG